MKILKPTTIIISMLLAVVAATAAPPRQTPIGKPDLAKIKEATTTPASKYYYPKLRALFMSSDTTMTSEAYQYFYYGTMFQHDYDPYRKPAHPGELEALAHIYSKPEPNRSDRSKIRDYAFKALADNPLDLEQINNMIYVSERNGTPLTARIWQSKLNHLLEVIARSGTGADGENAWIVVYPNHEYFMLNLSGVVAVDHRFESPYDIVSGRPVNKKDAPTRDYYFNIGPMLEQYYLTHPDEE